MMGEISTEPIIFSEALVNMPDLVELLYVQKIEITKSLRFVLVDKILIDNANIQYKMESFDII